MGRYGLGQCQGLPGDPSGRHAARRRRPAADRPGHRGPAAGGAGIVARRAAVPAHARWLRAHRGGRAGVCRRGAHGAGRRPASAPDAGTGSPPVGHGPRRDLRNGGQLLHHGGHPAGSCPAPGHPGGPLHFDPDQQSDAPRGGSGDPEHQARQSRSDPASSGAQGSGAVRIARVSGRARRTSAGHGVRGAHAGDVSAIGAARLVRHLLRGAHRQWPHRG
ncbi:hypothetical protein D3C71_726960 [compost metagenome]